MTSLDILRQAYQDRNLTLYLGAGVSKGSGLPDWQALILAMYFKVLDQQRSGTLQPFPNYLFAIAEWQLQHLREPLEITARKIRQYFKDDQPAFFKLLRETLYKGFQAGNEGHLLVPSPGELRSGNSVLQAVADLCQSQPEAGVKTVVTYNYDSLLEHSLDQRPHRPIWQTGESARPEELPIYHVHGYIPLAEKLGSRPEEIVFTEDQYNRIISDPYSWSNLVQIHCLSSTVGLMIGLSLSDRNLRRLLDAVLRAPIRTTHFALLQKPQWEPPTSAELEKIDAKAQDYYHRFEGSGVKRDSGTGSNWQDEIARILQEVQNKAAAEQTGVLNELGITPIWFDKFADIPQILREIRQ